MLTSIDPHVVEWGIHLALVGWMIAVSVVDHLHGRIPNWLTAPVALAVGAFRLWEGLRGEPVRFLLLVVWVLIFVMWGLHFVGGGDAKFLMALYALFPTMEFTAVLALILLVLMVPIVLLESRGQSFSSMGRSLRARVVTGQVLPSEAELHSRGRRFAWTFAAPGILHTLFWW